MLYVHYADSCSGSAKALINRLGCRGKIYHDPTPTPGDTVLVWGGKKSSSAPLPQCRRWFNPFEMVIANRDKYSAIRRLRQAGVSAPRVSKLVSGLPGIVIGRTPNHRYGSGFWFCPTSADRIRAQLSGASYFVEYIPVDAEYRVHVFCDRVVYACQKVAVDNPGDAWRARMRGLINRNITGVPRELVDQVLNIIRPSVSLPDPLMRSDMRGWKFVGINSNDCETLCATAISAVLALGLHAGAVDIIQNSARGYAVLEVNTGPGLENGAMDAWVQTLQEYVS